MHRKTYNQAQCLVPALAFIFLAASCTMDVPTPIESPSETWDPALNKHPDGPALQDLLNRYIREGFREWCYSSKHHGVNGTAQPVTQRSRLLSQCSPRTCTMPQA
jgi:hypothetical protein